MDATDTVAPTREPGALVAGLALGLSALWVIGAVAAAFALLGAGVFSLSLVEGLALLCAVVLPAAMAVFSGLAARDGARARAEAARLADAADRLLNPQMSASEAARRVTMNIRGEIAMLDQALEQTLARLQEVEGHIARQSGAVSDIADRAKAGANEMISGMEREREELLRISRDLNSQAQAIGSSISRHTQAISEAAKKAETEVRAADQALDHRITSFGAAAALISDRTQGLSSAAQASADSALRLESALANALDVLAKASNLTDAARQSAEAATLAANSTAGAVRDSTERAIDDAKMAAESIRGEAMGIEREAAVALERLREAAEAAREAAAEARAAAEAAPQTPLRPRQRPHSSHQDEHYDAGWRDEPDPLEDARPARRPPPPPEERPAAGDWTWRDLLSGVDNASASRARSARRPAEPAITMRRQPAEQARPAPTLPIVEALQHAGIELDKVFSRSGLERIAQRARSGTQARRRAVQDAAPDATRQVAEHLAADGEINQEAMQFMRTEGARITELLGRGRAAMEADATRAFLLLDAAAG